MALIAVAALFTATEYLAIETAESSMILLVIYALIYDLVRLFK